MEDENLLDLNDERDIFALHFVFLPVINSRMNEFRMAWNSHRLRTENNRSPEQLWLSGMLKHANSNHSATSDMFSQAPSLQVHIEEALQQFNLDLEPFQSFSGLEVPENMYNVDDTTQTSLHSAISTISDVKLQYTEVRRLLNTN
jgi:hypothetical protein